MDEYIGCDKDGQPEVEVFPTKDRRYLPTGNDQLRRRSLTAKIVNPR